VAGAARVVAAAGRVRCWCQQAARCCRRETTNRRRQVKRGVRCGLCGRCGGEKAVYAKRKGGGCAQAVSRYAARAMPTLSRRQVRGIVVVR